MGSPDRIPYNSMKIAFRPRWMWTDDEIWEHGPFNYLTNGAGLLLFSALTALFLVLAWLT